MNPEEDGLERSAADRLVEAIDEKVQQVRTQSLDLSFNELLDMYRGDELIIDPDFQRLFRWSEGAQSRFIESLLLELPIPPIFLVEREDRVYELVDGLQRISSYLHFRGELGTPPEEGSFAAADPAFEVPNVPLTLSECDIVTELNGMTYKDLPRSMEIKLKRAFVRAEILRVESDHRLRYYMFKRLNTGGAILSDQEVRNAAIRLLSTDFNSFIIRLSEAPSFESAIDAISENARRRKFDQELVLRFFAFKNAADNYVHEIGDFLTEYMENVSDPTDDRFPFDYEAEEALFLRTFEVLNKIANKAGYKNGIIFGSVPIGTVEPRGQFSVYHFEGITIGLQPHLANIDLQDDEVVSRLAAALRSGKADPVFLEASGAGKNATGPFRKRVQFWVDAFGAALEIV